MTYIETRIAAAYYECHRAQGDFVARARVGKGDEWAIVVGMRGQGKLVFYDLQLPIFNWYRRELKKNPFFVC